MSRQNLRKRTNGVSALELAQDYEYTIDELGAFFLPPVDLSLAEFQNPINVNYPSEPQPGVIISLDSDEESIGEVSLNSRRTESLESIEHFRQRMQVIREARAAEEREQRLANSRSNAQRRTNAFRGIADDELLDYLNERRHISDSETESDEE